MFDNLKNLAGALGQAKQLREKYQQLLEELERRTVEGEAGAGAVRVVVNGKFEVLRVHLDRPLLRSLTGAGDDADDELIEDLIAASVNAALAKARELVQQQMSQLTGGLNIPGMESLLGPGD